MIRIVPPIRASARVGLAFTLLLLPGCAGQGLAEREGISFRYSRLASFREVSPQDPLYTRALADALRITEIPEARMGARPRVVKGSSYWIDPPYLGRTSYLDGSIFVWEGTAVPLREVLTHEMIHWVLFHGGMNGQALNERYVENLTWRAIRRDADSYLTEMRFEPGTDLADKTRWYDVGVRERNAGRHRASVFDQDESDAATLSHERTRTWMPQHPRGEP